MAPKTRARLARALVAAAAAAVTAAQGGCPNGGPASVVYNKSAAAAWVARAPQHTSRTGRPLRLLEPADGVCLHGAGQDPGSYSTYSKFMSTGAGSVVPPTLMMTYMQVKCS